MRIFLILKLPLLTFILSLLMVTNSYATTYYFSTSGSDANSGLTTALPKQSITAAVALMTGGNIILFKRGDAWYLPMTTINLSNKSNFTLDAYGTGNKPIIAGMALLNSWTYTGSNNIYSQTHGYYTVARVFVNGVSRINVARKYGNSNSLAALDSTDEYFHNPSTGTLYIKMPTLSPPTNVEIIPGGSDGYGPPFIQMENTTNVTINNLDIRGGGTTQLVYIKAPSSNITINGCTIQRAAMNGIFVINTSVNMNVAQNITVTNCIVDKGWTLAENNVKDSITLNGDGIAFLHGVNTGLISGNQVSNWGHSAILLGTYSSATGVYGVKYVKVENNDVTSGNSGYMHALDIYGMANQTMYNIIKRNYFHHFNSACNISGNTNFIFSNIFSNVTVSPVKANSHQPHGGQITGWTISAGNIESKNNWIVNNTFYNTDAYSLMLGQSNEDTTSVTGNRIVNNIMMNFGRDTSYPLDPDASYPPPRVAIRIQTYDAFHYGMRPGSVIIQNNNFWANYDTTATRKVALYGTGSYNVSQFNNCTECTPNKVTGNVMLNPRFGNFFDLSAASSVTLRSGGLNYGAALISAGLPSGEFVDYYGNAWPTTPSLGAIQY